MGCGPGTAELDGGKGDGGRGWDGLGWDGHGQDGTGNASGLDGRVRIRAHGMEREGDRHSHGHQILVRSSRRGGAIRIPSPVIPETRQTSWPQRFDHWKEGTRTGERERPGGGGQELRTGTGTGTGTGLMGFSTPRIVKVIWAVVQCEVRYLTDTPCIHTACNCCVAVTD